MCALVTGVQTCALPISGFTVAAAGRSDVNALVKIVAAQGYSRIFHTCGRDRRTFDPAPIAIIHRYVYEAAEAGDANGLKAAMPEKGVALINSPRAGRDRENEGEGKKGERGGECGGRRYMQKKKK